MLSRLLDRFHGFVAAANPWTNVYGVARSLLAISLLSTLLANETGLLFRPAAGIPDWPHCGGAPGYGLFCVVPSLGVGRVLAVLVLVMVASGWRPRLTAIPHWYVTWSYFTSATVVDGGDQLNAILTLLLVPIALGDGRRWHWTAAGAKPGARPVMTLWALLALAAVRVQVAVVYFEAAVAKLRVQEWRDGTATYYYLLDPVFGAPGWMRPVAEYVLTSPAGVTAVTWGTIVLEAALFAGLLARTHYRNALLLAGIAFHVGIAAVAGLVSFSTIMVAACVVYLRPFDQPLPLRSVWRLLRSDRGR